MRVPVVLTCADSQIALEAVELLRSHPDHEVEVIGVDMVPPVACLARQAGVTCFQVPAGDAPGYVSAMLDIVRRTDARLVLPGSDEECLALCRHAAEFASQGAALCCPSPEVVELCGDKLALMQTLAARGLRSGAVHGPTSLASLRDAAAALGYPRHDVVLKPRRGRGSRGFALVASATDRVAALQRGERWRVTREELEQIFEGQEQRLGDFLLMEYYPGDKYSADVLCEDGRTAALVLRSNGPHPKVRPPTQDALLVGVADAAAYASRVVELLGAGPFVQVEMGRARDGSIGLVEVNPRLDATLPITRGAGLDFYRELVTWAVTGRFRPDLATPALPRPRRFRRHWRHLFEDTSE